MTERSPVVTDVAAAPTAEGRSGALWSLPHDGDLDANLVVLEPGDGIAQHVNDDVDVLVVVRRGSATLDVDGQTNKLSDATVALIPRGCRRAITAGADGVAYLSIHRRRGPLQIGDRRR